MTGRESKGVFRIVSGLMGALVLVLLGNAYMGEAPAPVVASRASAAIAVDAEAVAVRLGEALRFATISHRDAERVERAPFVALREWLVRTYPRVHGGGEVERHEFGEGQLYEWPGSDADAAPLLLLAHLDVVPAAAASASAWTRAPFGGEIADGFVWGRGALDDKSSAIAIYEALETLLVAGVRPRRTVYFAVGEDEEVRGLRGAGSMAVWLTEREVRPFMILDEGMVLLEGAFDGVEAPVGLVGVVERGYATLELLAEAEGGHSSMPPERTAVFALSRALARLDENPMPVHMDGVVGELLDRLSFEQPLLQRIVTANRWLFGGLIAGRMEGEPGPNAMLRTTFAPTIVRAGEVENALPTQARAWVNARVHPADSLEEVLAHVRGAVEGTGVKVCMLQTARGASPVSPAHGAAWEVLGAAVAAIEPGAVLAPGLVVGATDARHYAHLSEHVYRFIPMRLVPGDLPRIHGVDERIGIENLGELVRFYLELVLAA